VCVCVCVCVCGPGSVVGIATGYGLNGPEIESRWGARLSAPVQTGLGTHPASCTRDTGSFPGVKSGRGMTLTPHPFLLQWSRKSRAIPILPLWAVWPVQSLSASTRVHFIYLYTHTRPHTRAHAHIYTYTIHTHIYICYIYIYIYITHQTGARVCVSNAFILQLWFFHLENKFPPCIN